MDDWDSISNTTRPNSATDPSDAVLTPQPRRRRRHRQSREVSPSRGFVLLGLAGLVIASLASGITWLVVSRVSGTHGATVTVETGANATATAQAIAVNTIAQQIYTQATSGTPTLDDPLNSDNGDFSPCTGSYGDTCTFTGGAYHLTLPASGHTNWSPSRKTAPDSFALRVQVSIVKGNEGGVFFGGTLNYRYEALITSAGSYALYLNDNEQYQTLLSGSSSAIKTGLNRANVMTVIVKNTNFYLYVNNQYVASDTLGGYIRGWVGLVVYVPSQPTDAAFSDMKVWTL